MGGHSTSRDNGNRRLEKAGTSQTQTDATAGCRSLCLVPAAFPPSSSGHTTRAWHPQQTQASSRLVSDFSQPGVYISFYVRLNSDFIWLSLDSQYFLIRS